MRSIFFVWWNNLFNSWDSIFGWLVVVIGTTSARGRFMVSFKMLSWRNFDCGIQIGDEWGLSSRALRSNNPDYRSGPLLPLQISKWSQARGVIDPGISNLWGWTQGLFVVDVDRFIALDNPTHLRRYCDQASPPQPKSQWYYSVCKKGTLCRAFVLYSNDGIYTYLWGITVNSLWF